MPDPIEKPGHEKVRNLTDYLGQVSGAPEQTKDVKDILDKSRQEAEALRQVFEKRSLIATKYALGLKVELSGISDLKRIGTLPPNLDEKAKTFETSFTTFLNSKPNYTQITDFLENYYNTNLKDLKPVGSSLSEAQSSVNEVATSLKTSPSVQAEKLQVTNTFEQNLLVDLKSTAIPEKVPFYEKINVAYPAVARKKIESFFSDLQKALVSMDEGGISGWYRRKILSPIDKLDSSSELYRLNQKYLKFYDEGNISETKKVLNEMFEAKDKLKAESFAQIDGVESAIKIGINQIVKKYEFPAEVDLESLIQKIINRNEPWRLDYATMFKKITAKGIVERKSSLVHSSEGDYVFYDYTTDAFLNNEFSELKDRNSIDFDFWNKLESGTKKRLAARYFEGMEDQVIVDNINYALQLRNAHKMMDEIHTYLAPLQGSLDRVLKGLPILALAPKPEKIEGATRT